MIKRKKKRCIGCDTDQFLYGHKLCNICYFKNKAKEQREKKLSANKESKKERIKQVSDKQKERLKEYKKARVDFLLKKDHCEVAIDGCSCPYPVYNPTEVLTVHHKAGKIGSLLLDENYFLAVCGSCHRYVEDHPQWAYDNGYSIPRHQVKPNNE